MNIFRNCQKALVRDNFMIKGGKLLQINFGGMD